MTMEAHYLHLAARRCHSSSSEHADPGFHWYSSSILCPDFMEVCSPLYLSETTSLLVHPVLVSDFSVPCYNHTMLLYNNNTDEVFCMLTFLIFHRQWLYSLFCSSLPSTLH
ncbi:hypothetical protein GQ457_02G038570 [Hibiscus cannabinus]